MRINTDIPPADLPSIIGAIHAGRAYRLPSGRAIDLKHMRRADLDAVVQGVTQEAAQIDLVVIANVFAANIAAHKSTGQASNPFIEMAEWVVKQCNYRTKALRLGKPWIVTPKGQSETVARSA